MNVRRWRIRLLFVAATVAAVVLAFGFIERAGTRIIRDSLAGELAPAAVDTIIEQYRDAFIISALAATGGAALIALALGHVLARAVATLRADTLARARGRRAPITRPPIAELQLLASSVELLAAEMDTRNDVLVRERDDLALLVGSVSEGMLQIDGEGRVALANPAARALLGLPPTVVGQPLTSVVRHAELRRFLERATASAAAASCEVTLDDRRVLVAARPVAVGAGPLQAAGTVVALTDLTELRRLEGVRRDFVANVSHELKTPLTSIRGYVETLLSDDLPAEVDRQFLEVIQKNAERLHHIVDDLLDLSRLESGGWRPELQRLQPRDIAEEVWASIRERAHDKRIDFTADGEDAPVVADPSGLRQVFSNLFDNAIRYTPEGGRITVRISAAPAGTHRAIGLGAGAAPPAGNGAPLAPRLVTVEVRDTGSGIPLDALARVFERFYRVDPARSRAEGGTGLGLSIVKHLVESMGGDVDAESELGKGTTVRVRLPAAT
jgi:two-component system, OmpR family, phosphate regulon sensor histidine kinase PhoR